MYYVIEIATGDTRIAGKGMYGYESVTDAVASFHSKLGTAMKSELYDTDLVIVIDDEGNVVRREKYAKPADEPTEPVQE